jgi:hypothetical protein
MSAYEAKWPERRDEDAAFDILRPPAAANENNPGSLGVLDHWPAAFIVLAALANLLWIGCLAWAAGWLVLSIASWTY